MDSHPKRLWVPPPLIPRLLVHSAAAGYKWETLQSSNAVMKALRPGSTIRLTAITAATAGARSAQGTWAALANSGGYVNLEAVPSVGCTPLEFNKNLASEATNVMQSYATYASTYQDFTYGNGQSVQEQTTLEVAASQSCN